MDCFQRLVRQPDRTRVGEDEDISNPSLRGHLAGVERYLVDSLSGERLFPRGYLADVRLNPIEVFPATQEWQGKARREYGSKPLFTGAMLEVTHAIPLQPGDDISQLPSVGSLRKDTLKALRQVVKPYPDYGIVALAVDEPTIAGSKCLTRFVVADKDDFLLSDKLDYVQGRVERTFQIFFFLRREILGRRIPTEQPLFLRQGAADTFAVTEFSGVRYPQYSQERPQYSQERKEVRNNNGELVAVSYAPAIYTPVAPRLIDVVDRERQQFDELDVEQRRLIVDSMSTALRRDAETRLTAAMRKEFESEDEPKEDPEDSPTPGVMPQRPKRRIGSINK